VEIPSREAVLEELGDAGVPLDENELAKRLKVDHAQWEGFTRRLARDGARGQVMRNRRGAILIADKAGLIRGKVIGHPDGYGFLKPDDGKDDLFLAQKQMEKVLHGDVVLARVTGVDRRGRLEGRSSKCSSARTTRSWAPLLREQVRLRHRREQAHQPGHPDPARELGGAKAGRWSWPRSSSSRRSTPSPWAA
jgi:ribonuclease R